MHRSADLERELARLTAEARAAWPGVVLPDDVFGAYLVEKLPASASDRVAGLRDLHATDLYLACACVRGDPPALALFEERFVAGVARFLGGVRGQRVEIDDVKQSLRTRLLVGEGEAVPRIAEYAGRGPLGAWLRRAAIRQYLALRQARVAEGPLVPDVASLPSVAPDAELLYLKVKYGQELDRAFRATLDSLSEHDTTILHLYFVNGMTAERLAVMYGVTERTVRRWVAEGRQRLVDETRRRLAGHLQISASECRSLVAVLQSQLDLSVVKFLKERSNS